MARIRTAAAALAVLTALAPAAGAHPHTFIDGGVDFRFDGEGRLAALEVTWIYDAMTSLFMLEDLGIDAAVPLAPEDRSRLAAYQTEWDQGFAGDSYLLDGEAAVVLSGPIGADAAVTDDGRVVITFERDVAVPFRPAPEAIVEVYDPTYYTAYAVTTEPALSGEAAGCRAEVVAFVPTAALKPLLDELAAVPADATPERELGRLLADRIRLACD
jgi:ABC-type uncharacterized transport system substrate-binding protein